MGTSLIRKTSWEKKQQEEEQGKKGNQARLKEKRHMPEGKVGSLMRSSLETAEGGAAESVVCGSLLSEDPVLLLHDEMRCLQLNH